MKRREEKNARLASTESNAGLRKKLRDLQLTSRKKTASNVADKFAAKRVLTEPPSRKTKAAERTSEVKMIAENPETCFALLIGVDEYETLGKLEYASSDAKALRDALISLGFLEENIWLYVSDAANKRPTKRNIDNAFENMLREAESAGPNSTIFIALSGHGFETLDGNAAFCPTDVVCEFKRKTLPKVKKESAVVIDEWADRLYKHCAAFKMMIVDACRSSASTIGSSEEYQRSFRKVNFSNIAFLQSCQSGEVSFEDSKLKKSVFTHYFIEGLQGKAENKDGGVTFLDVCRYTSIWTQRRAKKIYKAKKIYDRTQTPYFELAGGDFLLKEATQSVAKKKYNEGRALAWGLNGREIDGFRAVELLKEAANAGLKDAQAELALLYYDGGEATPSNFKKAVEYAIKAGDKNPIAQKVLGNCYKDGLGVQKDEEEANRLHKVAFEGLWKLAESGDDPLVWNLLARCYCNERGTKLNFNAAAKYFRRSAKLQCAVGGANLARMYFLGLGVKQNYAKAIKLYGKAIKSNVPFAFAALGDCYRDGLGVPRDYDKAVELYRQAVDKYSLEGEIGLGVCYENGWGVDREPEKAVRFYRQATERKNANAIVCLGDCYANGIGVGKPNKPQAFKLWMSAAEQNSLEAFDRLASCYEKGWGTNKDEGKTKYYRALEFQGCQKYAEAGSLGAMYKLAGCYDKGGYVEPDYQKAAEWYRRAAEKNETSSIGMLGVCYFLGQGVKKNTAKARKCFSRADKRGWLDAKYWLGACYYHGSGVKRDYEKAAEFYRLAAENNNCDAMCALGLCYCGGEGVSQNYDEAARWFRRAADFKHRFGLHLLAGCYYNGWSVRKNCEQAAALYREAADLGHADALERLGRCYLEGSGVETDYPTAIQCFRDAAERDCPNAFASLGYCYYNEIGVQRNYEEAVKWLSKGAELKSEEAITLLGGCYELERGVKRNPNKAAALYREAAEMGYADAMTRLGVCYFEGIGVRRSKKETIRWLRNAAELKDARAAFYLGNIYAGKDEAESTRWYCASAELGYSDGAALAGRRYMLGEGVRQDIGKTMDYWRRAVELGNQRMLRCLGEAAIAEELLKAEDRFGVAFGKIALKDLPQNLKMALTEIGDQVGLATGIEYLEKAATLNDECARLMLGICFFYGVGVERDLSKAKKLFRLAAVSDSIDEDARLGAEWAENALDHWNENVAKLRAALEAEKERDGGESR